MTEETKETVDIKVEEVTEVTTTPQKKKKNGKMVAGIVVAIIVIVGAAFWVWHEQPSFCNAICHSPMDNYVETYYSEDPGMLSSVHENNGQSCLACHEAKINEQVTELCSWTADTFEVDADGNLVGSTDKFASAETCFKSGCHVESEVVAATAGFCENDAKYNPHASHQDGNILCGDCHKAHSTSVLYCNDCHSLNMPEGWEAPNDQQ